MAFTRVWDATYETVPDGGRQVNLGDDDINDFKIDVRERGNLEHDWGTVGGSTDTGRHKFEVGNLAARGGLVGVIPSGQIFFRTDRAGLDIRVAAAWVQQYFYSILTTAQRTALTNVDKGYLVFDTDLDEFFHGDGAAGWRRVNGNCIYTRAEATVANESPGSDNTWTDISGLNIAVATPNDGYDYQIAVFAAVKYALEAGAAQPCGFRILEDATARDVAIGQSQGAIPFRGVAALAWVKPDPTAGVTYTFKVQMTTPSGTNLDANPDDSLAGVPTTAFSNIVTLLQRRDT